MGIQQDSGEILLFLYKSYVDDQHVDAKKLLETTKWNGARIDKALKYLKDIGAIELILALGNVEGVQNFILRGLTPAGINIVENQKEFKHTFGFEVNLGLIKFSWSKSEK